MNRTRTQPARTARTLACACHAPHAHARSCHAHFLRPHDRDSTLNAIRLFRVANNVVAYRFEIIEIVAAKGWLEMADRIVVITAILATTVSGSRKIAAWFRNLPVRLPVSIVSRTILLTSLLVSLNCSLFGARASDAIYQFVKSKRCSFTHVICHACSYYDVTHCGDRGLPSLHTILLMLFCGSNIAHPLFLWRR